MTRRLRAILTTLQAHPRYALMRAVARFATVRKAVHGTRRALHRTRLQRYLAERVREIASSPFAGLSREAFVAQLREDGVAEGLRLPATDVAEIRAFAAKTPCYADREPNHGFMLTDRERAEARLGKPILLAQYFNVAEQCDAVRRLRDDPCLQWLAGQYLESIPRFVGANLWWTFPVDALEEDRDRHAHLFHRDVDDFSFFKFFFYLTDVHAGEGAHVCVRASHRRPPGRSRTDRWKLRRYSDGEIQQAYPPEDIVEICGPAGTGFAENTLCVHKGLTPPSEARLLLQLQYALFDYGAMHDRRGSEELRLIV